MRVDEDGGKVRLLRDVVNERRRRRRRRLREANSRDTVPRYLLTQSSEELWLTNIAGDTLWAAKYPPASSQYQSGTKGALLTLLFNVS